MEKKKEKEEKTNPIVAERLRMLRAKKNYSQTKIAGLLGITQQTYSKFENGTVNPDSQAIIKLCDIYGVTSDYILGLDKGASSTETDSLSFATPLENGAEKGEEDDIEKIVQRVLEKIKKENGNK